MNKIKGSRILVTGGAGFIGSYIAEELLKEGADVVVYDNLIRGRKENIMSPDKIEFVEGDIRDYGKLNNLMKDIDYVFHEAAVAVRRCLKLSRGEHRCKYQGQLQCLQIMCREQGKEDNLCKLSISLWKYNLQPNE